MDEEEILEKLERKITDNIKTRSAADASGRRRSRRSGGTRTIIPRNREAGHDDIVANYFSEKPIYTDIQFRQRYRMTKPLFLRIVAALGDWSPYFQQRADATGRYGLSQLQKCTSAIRMLAYGTPADVLDEVIKIGTSTTLECSGKFAQGVIECFGPEYLRPPTAEELEKILEENESRGFSGMIGSIDCMYWAWKNCPTAWRGMFTHGDKGVPTMILEAVASRNLRIWHFFLNGGFTQRHQCVE